MKICLKKSDDLNKTFILTKKEIDNFDKKNKISYCEKIKRHYLNNFFSIYHSKNE